MPFVLGMTLLHPWGVALGAAAVALPVAIHILTRPWPVRVPLSTVRFVRRAIEQKKARYRLRDFLVLLLRTAAVALLGWAFARPLIGARPIVDPAMPGSVVRVIVLDDSLSMGATSHNSTALDRARSAAARYLRYQPGLRADVIIAAARSVPVFDKVSMNIGALRDAISAISPLPQGLDAQAAINRAGDLLATASRAAGGRVELVVISDFQRTNWTSVDFSPVPKDASIQLESVAPSQTPENIAILRVGARGSLEQGRQVRLEAEIGNYSSTPRDIQAEVDLGSESYHLQGLCPPRVKTTLSNMVTLPPAPEWLTGQAKLIGVADALAADNVRPLAIQVRALPVYALITSESSNPHPSSSHYLERALVPNKPKPGEASETVVRLDPSHMDRDTVGSASLLVLDHPGNLSDEVINLLATLARRGRGILYVAAEPIDAENLARFERVCGEDLKMPVVFMPPAESQPRRDLFLLDWRRELAPFDQLGDTMAAVAGNLRFNRGLSSQRASGGLEDDVLAEYSDRSAALVVTPCGAGTLAVLNADLTASNLRASAVFVPLVEELCGRLLSVTDSADALRCGEPLAVYLPAECGMAQGLKIEGLPGSEDNVGSLSDESTGTLWQADAAGSTGVYQVKRGDRTVFAIATAAPAAGSDLQSIDPATLTLRLAAGRRVGYQSADDLPTKDQAWAWLLVGCAACLIGEVGLLKLFRT
jgi:hypothetical protein